MMRPMKKGAISADVLLLVTAAIWGFAFTAQRAGMDYIGPFLYSGIRFFLGALVLVPVWALRARKKAGGKIPRNEIISPKLFKTGVIAGIFLFLGVSFQQVGLLYTTAGKSGFITGLYVIIIPVLGIFWKQSSRVGTWIGAVFAVAGLYLLSFTGSFSIGRGDLLTLASAFFWALHVHAIGRFAGSVDTLQLAIFQYFFCSVASFAVAGFSETGSMQAVWNAALPLLYGGICSVGIAYTLQVVAQKSAPASHAAIIMSLESVFAVLGGFLILGETLSSRGLAGCALMFCGMIISQLSVGRRKAAARD